MPNLFHVSHLDCPVDDWRWPFADGQRTEIDAYFARLREAKPQMWNGRVLLARDAYAANGIFHARYFETDFASFLAWRDWDFPDREVINGFGMGALRGSEGSFVLGEMSTNTANDGKIYFPAGTPDPSDVADGRLDIAASVAREVREETGLSPQDYRAGDGWACVAMGRLVAFIRVLDVPASAATIRDRIVAFLDGQDEPELCGVHVVSGLGDISPAMPDFIAVYLAAHFDATTDAS